MWSWSASLSVVGFTRVARNRLFVYGGWNMIVELNDATATATGTGLPGWQVPCLDGKDKKHGII